MKSSSSGHASGSGVPRRQFLKSSGAALAAPFGLQSAFQLLGGLSPSSAAAMRPAGRPSGFEHSGIFWFGPSFFDHCPGPWQPVMPGRDNKDVVGSWKKAIDWFSDNGLNFAVIQLAPFFGEDNPAAAVPPDMVRFGWGYHYVLNFEKFPEARTFEPDFVKRCQDIVRAITEHGKEKGVGIYTHHYNFYAPVPFLKAHPEVRHLEMGEKGRFVDIKPPVWDLRGNLGYDICWNKPTYQEFLKSCFEEYMKNFPAAAGIMATPGERARCQCVECIGEQPSAEAAKAARYQDSPEKRKTIISFVKAFDETVKKAGGKPLVRSWIAGVNGEWAPLMPKGVTYVTKYSVFDMMDGGPDTDIDPWLAEGHDMWFMKEHTGNENCGPMVMTVPEAFDEIAERSLKKGVKSMMGVVNCEHGLAYEAYRVQQLHNVLFANAFGITRAPSPEVAKVTFREIFEDKGDDVLKAARQIAEPAYQITRVIYFGVEGFTWNQPASLGVFRARPEGASGGGGVPDAPEWAAREIVPMGKYLAYLRDNPWTEDAREKITGSGKDPVKHLAAATATAKEGLEALEKLAPGVRADAKGEMDLLVASGQVAYWTGSQYSHLLETALLRAGALGAAPIETCKKLARQAVAEMEKVVEAIQQIASACEKIPADAVDEKIDRNLHGQSNEPKPPANPYGDAPPASAPPATAAPALASAKKGGQIAMRKEELAKLKEELKDLLA